MDATTILTPTEQRMVARFDEPPETTLRRFYAEGRTQDEIAQLVGASRATVIRYTKRYGLLRQRPVAA